jgi:hypothetical protein
MFCMMLPLHAELAALLPKFYDETIDDEEWAHLQIHLDYCDVCRLAFEQCEAAASRSLRSISNDLETAHEWAVVTDDIHLLIFQKDIKSDLAV